MPTASLETLEVAVFDFDGTLADSAALAVSLYNASADSLGVARVGPDDLRRLRRLGALEALAAMRVPPWKLPRIVRAVREGMRERMREVAPFPGVEAALRGLRARGVRCFVLTTNARENVVAFLEQHDLSLFESIDGGASVFGKAARLRALLRRIGVAPARASYIGDEQRDIDAARAVGTHAVSVAWGYGDPEALAAASPDALVDTPARLLDALVPSVAGRSPGSP